jgi:MFS family permease
LPEVNSAYSASVRRAALPVTTFVQAAYSAAVIGPTVAAPLLLQRLQLGPAAVGVFVALVYLGASLGTQIGVFGVRRWGPIRASQLALLCTGTGLLFVALPVLPLVVLGAALIGLGYWPITPASSQMLSRTTDPRHYSLVFSIKQTGVPLGGVLAGLIVPPLAALGGAVGAVVGVAALCLVATLSAIPLSKKLNRDRDPTTPWPRPGQALAPMRFVAADSFLRVLALCSFVFSIVQVSLTSYMVSFLMGDLRWSLAAAGAALAASQAGGVAARIGWGFVSDKWLGPRRMLVCLALAMAVCGLTMPLLTATTATPLVVALLVLYGATAVGWNGVYLATVARVAPEGQAATATAGSLFFTFFGVVVGPPAFGAAGSALGALGWAFALLALPLVVSLWMLLKTPWK